MKIILPLFVFKKYFTLALWILGVTFTLNTLLLPDKASAAISIDKQAFIERFYQNILSRPSDSSGMENWLGVMKSKSATQVAFGFFNSAEFNNLNLDDADFVNILYQTLFDRVADEGGYQTWMAQLKNGALREMVIYGFLRSQEFANLADRFNVKGFSSRDNTNFQTKDFVKRFYTLVLAREPDAGGFNDWNSQLVGGTRGGADIAKGFFNSQEFISRNLDDIAFVDIAYRAFFNREADAGGKANWLAELGAGKSRQQILDGFIGSQEFFNLTKSFGINVDGTSRHYVRLSGGLGNANVSVFTLDDLETPHEGPRSTRSDDLVGGFHLALLGLPDDEWIVVQVEGGQDSGNGDVTHNGSLYAIGRTGEIYQGIRVNYLSDIAWRYTRALIGKVTPEDLALRLKQIAEVLLAEDIDGDGIINHVDLLRYDPDNLVHQGKLKHELNTFLTDEVLAAYNSADNAMIDSLYQQKLGPWLVRNAALPADMSQYRLDLLVFGDAKVTDSLTRTVFDSSQNNTPKQRLFYSPNSNLTLTAIPASGYQLHSWTGCDTVSADLTQCQISLNTQVSQIKLNLVTEQIQVSSQFKDLSPVTTEFIDAATIKASWAAGDIAAEALIGSVLTGDYITGSAGEGFLKEVTAITVANNHYLFSVIDASLSDVIESGSAYYNRQLTYADLDTSKTTPGTVTPGNSNLSALSQSVAGLTSPQTGIWLQPGKSQHDKNFVIHFGQPENVLNDPLSNLSSKASFDVIVYDKDGNEKTTSDQVKINGTLTLSITANFGVEVKGWLPARLHSFKFVPTIDMSQSLTIKYSGGLKHKYNDKTRILVKPLKFKPIKFMVGPVPVFITHKLNIYLGWDGKVEAAITSSVKMQEKIEAGVVYKRDAGGWNTVGGADMNFNYNAMPKVTASAEAKGIIEPEYVTHIYGLAGPAISVKGYAGASVKLIGNTSDICKSGLSYNFYIGSEGKLKFDISDSIKKLFKLENSSKLSLTYFGPYDYSLLKGLENSVCPKAGMLRLSEMDMVNSYPQGSTEQIIKTYTLHNEGDTDLKWSVDYFNDAAISIQPESGTVPKGGQTDVNVTIDLAKISKDKYQQTLKFKNESNSEQSTQHKSVMIYLVPLIAKPTWEIVAINSNNDGLVDLAWNIDSTSLVYLQGFSLYVNGVPQPDTYIKTARQAMVSGLPRGVELNLQLRANSAMGIENSPLSESVTMILPEYTMPGNLNSGLVGHYKFEGNANNSSGSADNGKPTKAVTFGVGKFGQAAIFHGMNKPGHILIPNSSALKFTQGATYSLWVRVDELKMMDGYGRLTTKRGGGAIFAKSHDRRGAGFMFILTPNGIARASIQTYDSWRKGGSAYQNLKGKSLGEWIHVAYTLSAKTGSKIYLNGNLAWSNNQPVPFSKMNKQSLYIGKFSDSWYPFYGAIDELRIYNRDLTEPEVKQLYSAGQ